MRLIPVLIEDLKDVPDYISSLKPMESWKGFQTTAKSIAKDVITWIKSADQEVSRIQV